MDKLYNNDSSCCGCQACLNVCLQSAISMREDAYGFKYPSINQEKCINCGACLKKCDFQKTGNQGVFLNYPIKAYAAYHRENATLKNSTSGGVFTAFAEYVLAKGGSVFGCVIDEEFNVKLVRSDTLEGIEPMRGSKYLQSEIGFIYREVKTILKEGKMVLFTGTPCQVAALKSYLGNSDTKNLITIDLICHGVPSIKSFKLYISLLDGLNKKTKIKEYKFRSKEYGWGLKTSAIEIISEKKGKRHRQIVLSKNDFYKSNYLSWNSIRISCASCKYANNNRVGDFTMGDYWGWEKLGVDIPTIQGLSVLFVNTPKWTHLLNSINMNLIDTPIDVALKGNGALNQPTIRGRFWDAFMECVANNDYYPFYQGFIQFKKTRNRKERLGKVNHYLIQPLKVIWKLFNH